MEKKEYQIGEVFQCGLVKLKCVKAKCVTRKCYDCYLYYDWEDICLGQNFVGECEWRDREDKNDVIFVKVEE